jgi:CubicO group peptidase (beta-lactamase class C family)
VECRSYGYSNLESKQPVTLNQGFCIASITKSFTAVMAMQLRDEGKLDLHKPVLEILPSLPIRNDFGAITAHHLLTHTSGLPPNWHYLLSSIPNEIAVQAYKPGERYSYCNMGFDALGVLIAYLDGRSWPEALHARVLQPLEMNNSSGKINAVTYAHLPTRYQYLFVDRPNVVSYPLIPVAEFVMERGAGSVSVTAADMAKYIQMFASGGVGPHGRLLSSEGFELMSTPHIAPALGPTSSYGYGIGVETLDGHKFLRHTGGFPGFSSSIVVDLDAGVGAFASINSLQGSSPTPVTLFAVKVLNARKAKLPVPTAPEIADPLIVKNPGQYAGAYTAPDGEILTVSANGTQLTLRSARGATLLYPAGRDSFSAVDGSVLGDPIEPGVTVPSEFAVSFARAHATAPGANKPDATPSPVVELSVGSRWYAGEHYQGPRTFAAFPGAARFIGKYYSDVPWYGLIRIIERNGALWLVVTERSGSVWLNAPDKLHPDGDNRFYYGGKDEGTAVPMQFSSFINGRAYLLHMDGDAYRRVDV